MSKQKKKFDVKKGIIWVVTVMISITAILVGNRAVLGSSSMFLGEGDDIVRATVTDVMDSSSSTLDLGGEAVYENTAIAFRCMIEQGPSKGQMVDAEQTLDGMYAGSNFTKEVEKGDKVLVLYSEDLALSGGNPWQFSDYYRFDKIIILLAIFMVLILIIGRWKGVNTLLSLLFTFAFVFMVFVPAVMAGYNAYLWASITCIFTIMMTLILINSISKKTWATIIGCVAGTIIAAAGTVIMTEVMQLTGFVDEHSYYLTLLDTEVPINLTAIVFAAIVIGAVGAIMDVAMDLSSSLYELSEHVPDITFGRLCKSGMAISRDIMGTMANTLVLAYIGSSLSCIMILLTYSTSAMDLMNREVIIVELLQAIIGSLAILLTAPCTVVTCGVLYLKHGKKKTGVE
ncbi:MAG: YibE/F family protein [Firmicutes bacterium]|nr:YibE/F family protein [Bacillota bacterium]MBQ4596631.1 YibE/F family protein [Bacillota bacterium]